MAPSSRLHLLCWTLVALAFMLVKPATAQDCSVARYGLTLGHDSTEYMTVRRGGACTQVVTAPGVGGFTEREATLSGISLISRARHGNAGVAGRSTYAYKARPGYVGPDQFVVLARGAGGSSRIIVQVNVVP
jgi:hypothetical protein